MILIAVFNRQHQAYKFLNCFQNKWNFCDSGPCQNNGRCHDKITGFVCECAAGYHGELCQHEFNMCVYKKCYNGGVCQSISGEISCLCAPGFSGKQCDKSIIFFFNFFKTCLKKVSKDIFNSFLVTFHF